MCVPQCVYMWIESPQYEYFLCTFEPTLERLSATEPSGVCVIQIPYGGSPAATHDGIPMKYSTFMSNTWLPSRWSRIARFVSFVIQFSGPISSRGPHGLFETLTPPRLRTVSGCSSGSRAMTASCDESELRLDALRLLDQRVVQLGAAVAVEVELVVAGDDVVLVARLLDVDVRY